MRGYSGCYASGVARPNRLADAAEERFWLGVHAAERFFMGEAEVQKALERLVQTLDAQGIPYAIVGAMALNEFGYRRVTVDVDVLLTLEGLAAFKETSLGAERPLGYDPLPGFRERADAPLWARHPRVFLDPLRGGEAVCPYCGTRYTFTGEAPKGHH